MNTPRTKINASAALHRLFDALVQERVANPRKCRYDVAFEVAANFANNVEQQANIAHHLEHLWAEIASAANERDEPLK